MLVDETDRVVIGRIGELLQRDLPDSYRGWPVRFATTWDADVTHRVEVATVGRFAASRLGVNPVHGLSVLDWLTMTGQGMLEVTAGPVFADQTSELGPVRALLRWYPPDIDRYVLAAGWQRISQDMPLLGRTGQLGDELGSRLLSASLARDLMRQAFLLDRRWHPYGKWFGAMFAALPSAPPLAGLITTLACAEHWRQREDALAAAIETMLSLQRARGMRTPARGVISFFDRPYRGVDSAMHESLLAEITDPEVARLPPGVGCVEQWADNTDVLAEPSRRAALTAAYRAWISPPG